MLIITYINIALYNFQVSILFQDILSHPRGQGVGQYIDIGNLEIYFTILYTADLNCNICNDVSLRVCNYRTQFVSLFSQLLHPVERTAGLEPLDLLLVERVVQMDLVHGPVLMLQLAHDGLKQNFNSGNFPTIQHVHQHTTSD